MLDRYFPKCSVEGSFEPVPFKHLASSGAVPRKCIFCPYLFEGECLRAGVNEYRHLDHGPCPVKDISSSLVEIKKKYEGEMRVFKIPAKCERCEYLGWDGIRLFYCKRDSHIWGDFPRGLDFSGIEVEGIKSLRPIKLHITSGMGSGKDAIKEAKERVLEELHILPNARYILIVIEGDSERMNLHSIGSLFTELESLLGQGRTLLSGIYEIPAMKDRVCVHVVQSL